MGALDGGLLDEVVARNKVTRYLTAITVITVGVVNCFFLLGLMRWGAGAMQLERRKEAAGGEGVFGETDGVSQSGRREKAMECWIELSEQVMIRRPRCGHVRNEFHAC